MTIHSLLTPENCTVILSNHQPQMAFGGIGVEYASTMVHGQPPSDSHTRELVHS